MAVGTLLAISEGFAYSAHGHISLEEGTEERERVQGGRRLTLMDLSEAIGFAQGTGESPTQRAT